MRGGVLVVLGALGCRGADETAPPDVPVTGCEAGTWEREDGMCIDAGLPPDMPCPPAEWFDGQGNCVPAGVAADGCAEGFIHDGDRGCDAILPAEPCPAGLMAVPGETACREVAPCAAGKWGDIPVETDTEHVDASYAGMDSDGSAVKPWSSIQAAVDAAAPGAIVAIAAGSYVEAVVVNGKAVRLWGVCPRDVEIVGVAGALATIDVRGGANGTEVRDLAIRGEMMGLLSSGSQDQRLERVWVHDNADRGINVEDALGATSVTLRESLVEANGIVGFRLSGAQGTIDGSVIRGTLDLDGMTAVGVDASKHSVTQSAANLLVRTSVVETSEGAGVFVMGSEAAIEASVVRATTVDAFGRFGRGLYVGADPGSGTPGTLVVRQSIVERNREVGVHVESSSATLEASVVRNTELDVSGVMGRAVNAQTSESTGVPSNFVLRTSLLDHNHDVGLYVEGSEASVVASVVRNTQPRATGQGGRGVNVQAQFITGAPSNLTVQSSLLEHNHEATLFVSGSSVTVEATALRATQWSAPVIGGRGLNARVHGAKGTPSSVVFKSSIIEQHSELGLFAEGSDLRVESSVIRATEPNALGYGGRSIEVERDPDTNLAGNLFLYRSVVEQSHEAGVMILDSNATLEDCVVRDTSPSATDGFGHGVVVVSEIAQANALLTGARVERSALAGLAVWGGHVALGESTFVCQAFDFNTETYLQYAPALDDLDGNRCGCPEPSGPCSAVSANIQPPPSLAP